MVVGGEGRVSGTCISLLMSTTAAPKSFSEHPNFPFLVAVASSLAFYSGFVNGVFLITSSTFVSSINGLLALIARDFVRGVDLVRGALLLTQVFVFMAGNTVAGFVYRRPFEISFAHSYGICAVAMGIFFSVGISEGLGTSEGRTGSVFIAAFTMGFQNGMSTFFSKGVLRTTHQTGGATDLGLALGCWIHALIFRVDSGIDSRGLVAKLFLLLSYFGGSFSVLGFWGTV